MVRGNLPPHCAANTEVAAEPLHGAASHPGAGAVQVGVDLADPMDPGVLMGVDGHDLLFQLRVAQGADAGTAVLEGAIGAWGDLEVELLAQGPAERFDPPSVLVFIDEGEDHFSR